MGRSRVLALLVAVSCVSASLAHADEPAAEPVLLDIEIDPLPFALGGYGVQLGVRHPALRGTRISLANFSLDVPDAVAQLGGNDGFSIHVRWTPALYVLYYLSPPGEDGFTVGGAVRYLRLRYSHEEVTGTADTSELSPELIAGYQWHPFDNGFYAQPWLGLSVTLFRDGEPRVGDRTYDAMPVQPFFTVNIGYEHAW